MWKKLEENLNHPIQRQWLPTIWWISFWNVFSVYLLYSVIVLDAIVCFLLYSFNVFLKL